MALNCATHRILLVWFRSRAPRLVSRCTSASLIIILLITKFLQNLTFAIDRISQSNPIQTVTSPPSLQTNHPNSYPKRVVTQVQLHSHAGVRRDDHVRN